MMYKTEFILKEIMSDIRHKEYKLGRLFKITLNNLLRRKVKYTCVVYILTLNSTVLYVGSTTNLQQRFKQHKYQLKLDINTEYIVYFIPCLYEDRFILEFSFIYALQPKLNIVGKSLQKLGLKNITVIITRKSNETSNSGSDL